MKDAFTSPTCSSNGKFSTFILQELIVKMGTTHVTLPSYVTVALKELVSESLKSALEKTGLFMLKILSVGKLTT